MSWNDWGQDEIGITIKPQKLEEKILFYKEYFYFKDEPVIGRKTNKDRDDYISIYWKDRYVGYLEKDKELTIERFLKFEALHRHARVILQEEFETIFLSDKIEVILKTVETGYYIKSFHYQETILIYKCFASKEEALKWKVPNSKLLKLINQYENGY